MDEHDRTAHGITHVDTPIDPFEEELAVSGDPASVRITGAEPIDRDTLPPDPDPDADEPVAMPSDPDAYGETVRLATQLLRGTRLERARLAARELDRSTAAERAAAVDVAGLDASAGDPATLSHRLHALARAGDADLAEQIRLLTAFDEAGLWKMDGCRTCVQWMGMYLGIAESSAYERLYVGRRLPLLPWITKLFRVGELSWSQVLRLSRVATPGTERTLAAAALDLTIKGLDALCREYRHPGSASEDDDDAAAWTAWRERSADFRRIDEHTTELRVRLPHDMAADFRGALEHGIEVLRDGGAADHLEAGESLPGAPDGDAPPFEKPTLRQSRADALVLLGSRSLALAGDAVATADRYRVLLSVDVEIVREGIAANDAAVEAGESGEPGISARAEESPTADTGTGPAEGAASTPPGSAACGCGGGGTHQGLSTGAAPDEAADAARMAAPCALPTRRAVISGFGPVAPAVALRIACHAGLTSIATDEHGDVLGVGRNRRTLPLALSRALAARDPVCRVPGCRATRRLEDHHLDHWARGGDSALAKMTRVCHACHHWLHEGGYTLERMRADDLVLSARAAALLGTEAERRAARRLVATVVRYRLLDRDGRTVRESFEADGAVAPVGVEIRASESRAQSDAGAEVEVGIIGLLLGLREEAASARPALSARAEVSSGADGHVDGNEAVDGALHGGRFAGSP